MQFKWDDILNILPPVWHGPLLASGQAVLNELQELRIRQGRPLLAYGSRQEYALTPAGFTTAGLPEQAIKPTQQEVRHLLATISQSSLYALEEELRSGYVTIQGGHRIGITGKAVLEQGRVRTLKHFSGFNVRLAREVKGCAGQLLRWLIDREGRIQSTLLVSPPQAGKTTMLRDLARLLSEGGGKLSRSYKVAIIDERSELAACYQGIPQLDVGPRTDVLDACPKGEGMMMALRALSPEVIFTDEIGRREDVLAVEESVHCGVAVIATAHGSSFSELQRRPGLGELLRQQTFGCLIFLSGRQGPGTVEGIYNGQGKALYEREGGVCRTSGR